MAREKHESGGIEEIACGRAADPEETQQAHRLAFADNPLFAAAQEISERGLAFADG